MELIYILTYDCNFRCKYCDIDKRNENMSLDIVNQSFNFFNDNNLIFEKIKFFWWEPLLEKKSIKYITNKLSKPTTKFYVTSNSTLIDEDFIKFSELNNLKITFSIDGDTKTTSLNRVLENWSNLSENIINTTKMYSNNIRVNQVITSETSKDFFNNFKFIYNLWVREFNFLPAYYKEWSKDWLKNLKKWFDMILNFYNKENKFSLVNLENFSETSFFNLGIVIDTDGKIYWTNLILSWIFEKYKEKLVIWDIYSWLLYDIKDNKFKEEYLLKIKSILNKEYSTNVLQSVNYVDLILNNFCNEFNKK